MLYRNHQQRPRQGIILLVVLALLTLFASIGVAFVYFSEAEVNKSAGQKTGETVKLPDADLLFNIVLKQIIFPTNNTSSALFAQSLLENMYGRTTPNGPANISAFNGTGRLPLFDPITGQDMLYRLNYQGGIYNEQMHGSLNPTYTYPDHKNPYLGAVAANWRQPDFTNHIIGIPHGPVAIARSFAREMKFRIAFTTSTGAGFHEIILNPYSNAVFPSGLPHAAFWSSTGPLLIGDLPNVPDPGIPDPRTYVPNTTVTCAPDGTGAQLIITPQTALQHSLRPSRYTNPLFPPPGDLGGDVKNLPPEVKTLVGFNGTTPVFANNDSYWVDFGFPALPWSNNRKIKPMAAVFIKDNDGNVNLNVAGNIRGRSEPTVLDPNATRHVSSHGLGPWEINLLKLGIPISEVRQLMAGAQIGSSYIRGRAGISTADNDPITITNGYWPLVRGAPPYASYNLDGSNDGPLATDNWRESNPWLLAGDVLPPNERLFRRFPFFYNPLPLPYLPPALTVNNGYNSGVQGEYYRSGFPRSPLFISPFAPPQVVNNLASSGGNSPQRRFGFHNQESLYRLNDTGTDKLDGEIRKLMPTAFSSPQQRWQMTTISNDMNVRGLSPWFNNPTGDYTLSANPLTNGGTGPSQQLLTGNQAEFTPNPPFWRSKYGGMTRLDISRQLPDYPIPADNNTQLVYATDPTVQARYKIALYARQKMADEIYNNLRELMHPAPGNEDAFRYLGQIAVNIVDYIDNDDYPTWFHVPDIGATNSTSIVWGTELPRLVLNEVYVEAVNNPGDPLPMNQAQNDYDVRHWVELYNPLMSGEYQGIWPRSAGAPLPPAADPNASEARLNVGGSSAYRLIVARNSISANVTNMRANGNTLGYPTDLSDPQTKVVYFPPGSTVLPSDTNYGTGETTANNGFYLVGPATPNPTPPPAFLPQPPDGATIGAPVPPTDPLNFPTPHHSDVGMIQSERIAKTSGRFPDDEVNRSAIILQRLANPYLPHNPLNDPAVQLTGEMHDSGLPYNPYITIDYVSHIRINHAVSRTDSGSTADYDPVVNRTSIGKHQPYTSMNEPLNPASNNMQGFWITQRPDRDNNTANVQPLTNQPQHTFLRHNGVETDRPNGAIIPNPTPDASGLTYNNTLRLPFDWLTHLDRSPTSPAELLHVSGFKPHELTQQFNRLTLLNGTTYTRINPPAAPPPDLAPGNKVEITATKPLLPNPNTNSAFIGTEKGSPYSLKENDLVFVNWLTPTGNISEWVRVLSLLEDPLSLNHYASNTTSTFRALTNVTATGITGVEVRLIVPFAHYAPWYRAQQNVDVQSTSRLYRFLETVAVRNPGVDIGQYRFTVNNPANIIPSGDGYSVWLQLDSGTGIPSNSTTYLLSKNDAILNVKAGDAAALVTNATLPPAIGETLVVNANAGSEGDRVMVLEIDPLNSNRIRVLLNNPYPLPTVLNPMTLDYTYVAGRQPGRINLNTIWDIETFQALADAQPMNSFSNVTIPPLPAPPYFDDNKVDSVFHRLLQQRQPQYFYGPRLVGHTGSNGLTPEDRPLQGMGTGDIAASPVIPQQGIGNTFLSDRYQEAAGGFVPLAAGARSLDMNSPIGPDIGDPHRFTRTLFEVGAPGLAHPARRYELLSKLWNNSTVRSNTFSVWITIGFFEYDEANNSIGAELGQLQGKYVRHRFFAVVDRSSIDSWLQSWNLHAPNGSPQPASINLFMNSNLFPTLDPRHETYPTLNMSPNAMAVGGAAVLVSPGIYDVTVTGTNPFAASDVGRLVQVESGPAVAPVTEIGQIISVAGTIIRVRLTTPPVDVVVIRPLPVPPTVLHWSQLK
ncbi:MAG: hypothetical protein JNJ77_01055 [Planctomycetia bacterium]|nr:hypothetical protein [Planctomycetia bacterium]